VKEAIRLNNTHSNLFLESTSTEY